MSDTKPSVLLPPTVQDPYQNLYNQELINLAGETSVDLNNIVSYKANGEIVTGNTVLSYRYKYMDFAYADDGNGGGFSPYPTNKGYYGLRNTDSQDVSTNPADYVYYRTSGFLSNFYLFYKNLKFYHI